MSAAAGSISPGSIAAENFSTKNGVPPVLTRFFLAPSSSVSRRSARWGVSPGTVTVRVPSLTVRLLPSGVAAKDISTATRGVSPR